MFREKGAYTWTYDTRINDLSIDFGEPPTDNNPVKENFLRYFNDIDKDTQIREIVGNTLIEYADTIGVLEETYFEKTAVIDSNGNVYCIIRPIADKDGVKFQYETWIGDDRYKKYSFKQVFDISNPEEDKPLNFKKFRFPVYLTINTDLPDEYSGKLKPTT